MQENAIAIKAEGLKKSFGAVQALAGVDLNVPTGTVLALLGPNGAGKTTLVRILTTLLAPDQGRAWVAGYNLGSEPQKLRSAIGLAGQYAAVDENLTGRENLVMVGRLYHFSAGEARQRADALLEKFELLEYADRYVKIYSGGLRRRLDLAASLVGSPRVLFLDEPTAGLDPRSRTTLWAMIRELALSGTTILFTTQYMEEADKLADHIVVIDHGRIIARGSSQELKSRVGGDVLELHLEDRDALFQASKMLADLGNGEPQIEELENKISLPVPGGQALLAEAVRRLDAAGIAVIDLALHKPTLDDVFLALTREHAEDVEEAK